MCHRILTSISILLILTCLGNHSTYAVGDGLGWLRPQAVGERRDQIRTSFTDSNKTSAIDEAWRQVAERMGSLEVLQNMSLEAFMESFEVINIHNVSGPEVLVLWHVSEKGYNNIAYYRFERNQRRESLDPRFTPPEIFEELKLQWWETPEIKGPGIYFFPEEAARQKTLKEKGSIVNKAAVFHELLEREFVNRNSQDEDMVIGQTALHTDFAVISEELVFAALLGETEFQEALHSRRLSVEREAASSLVTEPKFAAYRDRVERLISEATYNTYRQLGEAAWAKATASLTLRRTSPSSVAPQAQPLPPPKAALAAI